MSFENPTMTEQDNINKDDENEGARFISFTEVFSLVKNHLSQRWQIVPTVGGKFSQNEVYRKESIINEYLKPNTKGWFFWKKVGINDMPKRASFEEDLKAALQKASNDLGGGKAVDAITKTIFNAFANDISATRSAVISQSLAIADEANKSLKRSIAGTPGAFKVVPQACWFSEELQKLSGRDLLTIFPEAEADVLLHVLGKAMIGYNGVEVVEGKIEHSARAYAIMVDQVGGLGKSTLMDWISEAVSTLGFKTSQVNPNMSKFGWGEVISADITFLDDLDNLKLGELISGHMIKSIVTNATVRTEQKGQPAIETKSTTTVLCASNTTDPRHLFDMDGGGKGRLNQLQTYTVHELDKRFGVRDNGFIKEHWTALAEKLKISVQTLAMYLLAKAAEVFSASIGIRVVDQRIVKSTDNLQTVMTALRADLRISPDMTYTEDFMSSISNFMALSLAVAKVEPEKAEKILTAARLDLKTLLSYLEAIANYPDLHPDIRDMILPDTLDKASIAFTFDKIPQLKNQKNVRSYAKAFETAMLELVSVQGFAYPKSLSFYDAKWNSATSGCLVAFEKFRTNPEAYKTFASRELRELASYLTA